jgi:hypothetical protein
LNTVFVSTIPTVATALTVQTALDALEVDASVFLDKLVSLIGRLSHDPNIDLLVLPIVGSEHTTEVSGTSPLGVVIATAAAVLSVVELLFHACIISGDLGADKVFIGFFVLSNESSDVLTNALVGLGATVLEGDGEGVVSPEAEETLFVEVGNFHACIIPCRDENASGKLRRISSLT